MTKIKKIIFYIFIAVFALVLTTLSIDAVDHIHNFSQSIVGSIFLKQKNQSLCPPDMVLVVSAKGDFCIDKYEASAGEGCIYQSPQNQAETALNLNQPECQPVSKRGQQPWVNISQDQAALACAKAGKRLPTSAEWFLASLGTPDPNSGWGPDDCQINNNWPKQPGLTGSGDKCRSAAGAYDMIGNVWEWVDGTIRDGIWQGQNLPDEGYVISTDGEGMAAETDANNPSVGYNNDYFWIKKRGVRGIARGGYWNNQDRAGQYAVYLVSRPAFAGSGVGFRCVKKVSQ